MPIQLSRPAQAALARAETRHSNIVMELERMERAGLPPEKVQQIRSFLDMAWERIQGLRREYGGTRIDPA